MSTNTTTQSPRTSPGAATGLKWSALLLALLGVVQAGLGGHGFTGGTAIEGHGVVGLITIVVSVIAAVFAFLATKGAESKGLFMHAAGMAVIAVVQFGLGEMHLKNVHMGLGIAFVLGAIALATLAFRKPIR